MDEAPHRSVAPDHGERRTGADGSDGSDDSDGSVEAQLGASLRERGETVAVAESCTGGLVGSLITDVAGASDYFRGGIVAYTNDTKRRTLGVSREPLERHGAVSEPVAREMARRVRAELDADWAISTTGYADGAARRNVGRGSADRVGGRPAEGTAFVGVAVPGSGPADGQRIDVERHDFDGSRRVVKARIARRALAAALDRVRSASPQ